MDLILSMCYIKIRNITVFATEMSETIGYLSYVQLRKKKRKKKWLSVPESVGRATRTQRMLENNGNELRPDSRGNVEICSLGSVLTDVITGGIHSVNWGWGGEVLDIGLVSFMFVVVDVSLKCVVDVGLKCYIYCPRC